MDSIIGGGDEITVGCILLIKTTLGDELEGQVMSFDPHSNKVVLHSFHCRHGRAYLFDKVVNVTVGVKEERMMMTGMHTVVDIFCVGCGSIVGWKYEAAHEKSQKYKEGKFILERFKILGPDGSNYIISPDAQIGGSDADD